MKKIFLLAILTLNLFILFTFAQNLMYQSPQESPSPRPKMRQKLLEKMTISTTTGVNLATPTVGQTSTRTLNNYININVDLECMKNAISKREDSLKSARQASFDKINQAYEERKKSLLNAWSLQNPQERQQAIKNSWITFRTTVNKVRIEYRKNRIEIWQNFVNERKKCGALPTGENPAEDTLNF